MKKSVSFLFFIGFLIFGRSQGAWAEDYVPSGVFWIKLKDFSVTVPVARFQNHQDAEAYCARYEGSLPEVSEFEAMQSSFLNHQEDSSIAGLMEEIVSMHFYPAAMSGGAAFPNFNRYFSQSQLEDLLSKYGLEQSQSSHFLTIASEILLFGLKINPTAFSEWMKALRQEGKLPLLEKDASAYLSRFWLKEGAQVVSNLVEEVSHSTVCINKNMLRQPSSLKERFFVYERLLQQNTIKHLEEKQIMDAVEVQKESDNQCGCSVS
jgi:hypothetical protein